MESCPLIPSDQRPAVYLFWLRHCGTFYSRLNRDVIREVYSYKCLDDLLPFLYKSDLAVYNLTTSMVIHYPKPAFLPTDSFLCLVSKRTAVALPYTIPSKSRLLVDLQQWTCQKLPSLREPKHRPAAIAVDQVVYTFGGMDRDRSLNSCEKMDVGEKKWERLPGLSRSYVPSACRYEAEIYLPGTEAFDQMDVYYLHLNSFRVIHIEAGLIWMPISIISDGQMTLLGRNQLCRWSIDKPCKRMSVLSGDFHSGNSTSCPIQDKCDWYWVDCSSFTLVKFNAVTLRVSTRNIILSD